MKLLKDVIAKIKPKKNSFKEEIIKVVETINNELRKNKIQARTFVGGSFAKDTHLIGDHDCDIFMRFAYSYKDKNISDLTEKALKQFKYKRVHGSRDYFQFTKSLNYEVVPVLKITNPEKAVNVTDVSPLHVAWTRGHKKSDEIRLAKAFCKANGIYGAESYIKGFSGHVLDILTIYYGSFIKLLKGSQKWKDKTIIDIEKYHKDALFELNTSKTQSPLIVIDPIQKDRNAAAALGKEAFDIFIKKAREFLKNPSEKAFEKKTIKKEDIKDAFIMKVIPLEGKRDVVGAKILKVKEEIERQLIHNGFEIKSSGWSWNNEALIWFKLKKEKIEPETTMKGPPIKMDMHSDAFKKMHKNVFEKKGILYAHVKRQYTDARKLLTDVIREEYIKEKTKKIDIL